MKEKWVRVKGFPDYEVSNFGRVKSYKKESPRLLRYTKNHKGYFLVKLYRDNKQHTFSVHRLVCINFNKDRSKEKGLQVNHIDGNKENNHSGNLEWCTNQENSIHAFNNNLRTAPKGEKCGTSKLKEPEVREIVKILNTTTLSCSKIGIKFGVSGDCVYDLVRGRSWQHLNLKINRGKHAK